ncbi:p-loop containing nucleoside triphosphate hydrolase protein [Favolaschia claudopus]|uniref:P-loop containing nucleoside triphosphate hydrolase protein n=1 Tax=Favolaschia claudopus TaxID=2862362 RepID=A0AAW0CI04_9AGAR
MPPRPLTQLLRAIHNLSLRTGRTWTQLLAVIISTIRKLSTQPQVAELFRFVFLGTIVETGRQVAQWILDFARDQFSAGDFAYDWVVNYLENHRVWNESRSFKVVARNAATRPYPKSNLGKIDGHPDPLYEPASVQSPSLFRWRGVWMSVSKSNAGWSHYDTAGYGVGVGGSLVISVWSRDRHILDEFVSAAREFYVNSQVLPRRLHSVKTEASEALLTVHFHQGDVSYDWMLDFLRSSNAFEEIMELTATTKQSNLSWGSGPKDAVRYMPAPDSLQRLRFVSPRTGRFTWLQVSLQTGVPEWDPTRPGNGAITITLHSSDREVLADLIHAAKSQYLEQGTSRVSVHLTDKFGSWAKSVSRSRRAFSTLILPSTIKEMILADAKEFLASERWYKLAGIPHRRDGAPGTGKSSTVHAIAGELGLEIYFISLANPGMDDFSLARLISDTPSRCILLIEDIDCAFPSREDADEDDDEEEEPRYNRNGNPIRPQRFQLLPPKSAVTLSGLLNVLDSVSSEEGRITFATVRFASSFPHYLLRIKYGLATTAQIEEVFNVFFSATECDIERTGITSPCTLEEIQKAATEFAAAIPAETFSIAQIQGYLLRKKWDPLGAARGAAEWISELEEEQKSIDETKHRLREERMRRRRAEKEYRQQQANQYKDAPPEGNAASRAPSEEDVFESVRDSDSEAGENNN